MEQAADHIAADRALVGLSLELVRTLVAHAHVAAGQRRRVARSAHADDALITLNGGQGGGEDGLGGQDGQDSGQRFRQGPGWGDRSR